MSNNSDSRVLGIDILKIAAMFLIIVGHLIAQYGIGAGLPSMSTQRYTVILLGIISSSAVNCYALCTGFLMINRKTRFPRLLELWFQIIFYSVGITLLFFLLMRYQVIPPKMDISAVQWLTSVTPIIRNSWWYASCYFGLYILIPIINPIIHNTSRRYLELFLFISIGLASVSALLYGDGLCFKFGYSIIWLVILYVLGAYVRIYNIKCNNGLLKWGGVVLLTWLMAFLMDITFMYRLTGEAKSSHILALYTSPFTILASVYLFLYFSSIKGKGSGLINIFIQKVAISTFGIYLIHTHDVIWDYFENIISTNGSIIGIVLVTICSSVGIFIVCFIIDIVRQFLFSKLNIRVVSEKISGNIIEAYSKRFNISK